MENLIKYLSDPVFYAIALAVLGVMKAVGELLEKIGKAKEGEDWFDSAGAFILKLVGSIGKLLNFFGIGNKQRK